ncbi:hypothetical protein ACPA9J_12520 [Pseudomonas aeruginosa]
MNNKTIPVTSPLLPPWKSSSPLPGKDLGEPLPDQRGDMHHALEEALSNHLG